MATPIKNILTSILPYGYNQSTKSYRFSLCIDLNPNYDAPQGGTDTNVLRDFLINFAGKSNSIFSMIVKTPGLKIAQLNKADTVLDPKGLKVCFPEVIKNVDAVWSSLPINTFDAASPKNFGFSRTLDISFNKATTMFKGSVPDAQRMRKSMMAELSSTKMEKKALTPLKSSLRSELVSINDEVENFASLLDGISSFSEQVNAIQLKSMLQEAKSLRYSSIYDSTASILEFWSFIDSNTVLQRLMGQIIDFEVSEDVFSSFNDGHEFELSFFSSSELEANIKSLAGVTWEHLSTPCKIYTTHKAIIVREAPLVDSVPIQIEAFNYDVGGKLISLKSVKEKYEKYLDILDDPSISEYEKYLIRKQLLALDTAAMTIGVNTYNMSLEEIQRAERNVQEQADSTNTLLPNYLYRIRSGYRFSVKSTESEGLTSIGLRSVSLKGTLGSKIALPKELTVQNVGINTDSGTHAFLKGETGNMEAKVVADPAMHNWNGENIGMPSVFSNQEDEKNFESSIDEGSISESVQFVTEQLSKFFIEDYEIKGVEYKRKSTGKFSRLHTNISDLPIQLIYSAEKITNKKLIFGREIQLFLTPEYKNKYAIPNSLLLKFHEEQDSRKREKSHCLVTQKFIFKRNEPVKPIEFRLFHQLLNDDGTPVQYREGESINNLVIRNFSDVDDDKIYKTTQTSIRHILPPAISFQQAMWHNKLFNDNEEGMTIAQSYQWYLKHHYPANEGEIKMDWDNKGDWSPVLSADGTPRRYTKNDAFLKSTRMKDFYPGTCEINYLPDPLTNGFRLEFFKDKDRLIKATAYEEYEKAEFYFTGKYPKINAWKISVGDYIQDSDLVSISKSNETITVRLKKGSEIFVTARTILVDDFADKMETFGNTNQFTKFGGNDLLTPPFEFSLVHAVQRPLVRPKFNNLLKCQKEQNQTNVELITTANLEQLYSYRDIGGITRYVRNTKPTGNIEVYAKWEEYIDDPKHITTLTEDWTPLMPVNKINFRQFNTNAKNGESPAVFEYSIEVTPQLENMERTLNKVNTDHNEFKNYAVDLKASYNIRETKYMEKWVWIKNKSQFTGYYPKEWGTEDESVGGESRKSREFFNRLSQEPFLIKILNNKKPQPPKISDQKRIKLLSVTDEWKEGNTLKKAVTMNRLRIFFERGRLTSGNGERIGFIVNEPKALYNNQMVKNNCISIVGKDIVSDTVKPYDGLNANSDVLLTKANFVIRDPQNIYDVNSVHKDDHESFSPKYIEDLGIMTYLPKFDRQHNLWYLDIELAVNDEKGKELHNPFLKFSLVHFQENSFNYNAGTTKDLSKDCRISDVYHSGYAYIMGKRLLTVSYGYSYVKPAIEFDLTSIKGTPEENLTSFFAVVREKPTGGFVWKAAAKKGGGEAFIQLPNTSNSDGIQIDYVASSNKEFQLVVIETENWEGANPASLDELIENRNNRIVLVSTFEITP